MTDTPETPFDLRGTFIGHSQMMAAKFAVAAASTTHGTTIGDASEDAWRSMLREFLPSRYAVSNGLVVDSHGRSSLQIDLIVHDRHFSPVFSTTGATFVPAESVYGVFEIKQDLSKAHVEAAAAKAASVRALHRTSTPITQLSQAPTSKKPPRILAGVLTGRNSWASLGAPLVTALHALSATERLDLGCVLDTGTFELAETAPASDLEVTEAEVGLAVFAMRLIARLNAMGTVPAMDVAAYTSPLSHRAVSPVA